MVPKTHVRMEQPTVFFTRLATLFDYHGEIAQKINRSCVALISKNQARQSKRAAFLVYQSVYFSSFFFSKFRSVVPFKSMIEEIIDSDLRIFVWDNPTVST